jgi:hypothetical protein
VKTIAKQMIGTLRRFELRALVALRVDPIAASAETVGTSLACDVLEDVYLHLLDIGLVRASGDTPDTSVWRLTDLGNAVALEAFDLDPAIRCEVTRQLDGYLIRRVVA